LLTNPSSGPLAQISPIISSTGGRDADVDGEGVDPAARMPGHDLLGGFLEHAAATAADHAVRAELDEALHHDLAESRAAAGDEESFALEQVVSEHRVPPSVPQPFV
jgi:hypothetical protein